MPKRDIYIMRGTIDNVDEIRTGKLKSGEPWACVDVFLTKQDGYAPYCFKFFRKGDNCSWVNRAADYEPGQNVEIEFTIQSRERESANGNTYYLTELSIWNIKRLDSDGRMTAIKKVQPIGDSEDQDDVPF